MKKESWNLNGFIKKNNYKKVSEPSQIAGSSCINLNGILIEQVGNKLRINGVIIDPHNMGYSSSKETDASNKTASSEFFEPGEHYLNNFSITVDEYGKLLSIKSGGGADIVVNGNLSNVVSSGSGDIKINGDVGKIVKSGSGSIYKNN